MACVPWGNERERADYYKNLFENQLKVCDKLEKEKDKSKWISVEDRLPDNSQYDWVLVQIVEDNGYKHIPCVMEYRQNKSDWFNEFYGWLSNHNGVFKVTHWQPIPEPPRTPKERGGEK